MEPEDLPWPGELEEEEEEEDEDGEVAAEAEKEAEAEAVPAAEPPQEPANLDSNSDLSDRLRALDSTDDDEDDEAKAWLQARPGGPFVAAPPPPLRYAAAGTPASATLLKRTESWHCLPQERDSFQSVDTSQTRIIARAEVTEVTDFPYLEDDKLTQSEGHVKESNRNLLCSSLLVIQDDFASPALPLLTCLTQDQEFGSDSLFHQSELEFAPLRGIPDKSEDSEWFSRPSEVSEALFQATSEASSDRVNSCFSISQHPLTGSTTVGSQRSFLSPEQGNNGLNVPSNVANELKTPKDYGNYDPLSSCMSWKTEETQQPEEGLQGKADCDVITLGGDTECSSLDEHAVVCIERVSEPPGQAFGQCDLAGECIEPEDLETLLDDVCDTSLHWHPASQLSPKEESNFRKPKGHSDLGGSQLFSSTLPPCALPEPAGEADCHSSTLRMLRVSPDIGPKSLQPLAGDTCNGDIVETIQSKLKSCISGDSDIESHSFLSIEDLPHLDVCFPKENTVGHHTDTVKQKALADSPLTKESLNVSNITEPAVQNTGTSTIMSASYSQRKKSNVSFQEDLTDGNKIDRARTVSIVSGPIDQKSSIPIVTSASYSQRDKPGIFYWQNLSGSPLPEEALKVSDYHDPVVQRTGAPTAPSVTSSQRQRPSVYYPQVLLQDGPHPGHILEPSDDYEPVDMKMETPAAASATITIPERERPSVYYQQPLLGGPLPEGAIKALGEPGDQRAGAPTASAASYLQRQRPSVYSPQALPGGPLPEEALKALDEPVAQSTGAPTVPSATSSQRQRPSVYYPQVLLQDGPHPGHILEPSDDYEPVDMKMETPAAASATITIPERERPSVYYQQPLLGGPLPEGAIKALGEPGDQRAGAPTASAASYLQRQRPSVYSPQALPGGPLPEEALKALDEPVAQSTGAPTVPSATSSQRQRPSVYYPQVLLQDGSLPGHILKPSDGYEPGDLKLETPAASSATITIPERQRPSVYYQQPLLGGPLPEGAIKALGEPGDQRAGAPTASAASYLQRQRPSVYSPQALPGGPLPEEALKALDEPVVQSTGAPTVPSATSSQRQRPSVYYPQVLLQDGSLPGHILKPSDDYGPGDLKLETPAASSATITIPERQRPSVYYQQPLLGGPLPEEAIKALGEPGDQRAGAPTASAASYLQRQRPSVYSPQALPGGPLPEEALKALDEPVAQSTGAPTVPSATSSQRQRPSVYYPQVLLQDGSLPGHILKPSDDYGPGDLKLETPAASSATITIPERQRPSVYYQQPLLGGPLPEGAIKALGEPGDQRAGAPTASAASYLQRQRPVYYPQSLPSGLLEEAFKVCDVPVDQRTGAPTTCAPSYLQRPMQSVYYPQTPTGSTLPEEAWKASDDYPPGDQRTGAPTASTAYLQRQKPSAFYQQGLLPEEAVKVSDEPVGQRTEAPSAPSASISQSEKPSVYYPLALASGSLLGEAWKASDDYGPVDPKTGVPTAPAASYLQRQRPSAYYQKVLAGGPLADKAVDVSDESELVDPMTGPLRLPSASSSQRQRPSVHYQVLPGGPVSQKPWNISNYFEPLELNRGTAAVSTALHSQRERPSVHFQPALPGGLLPEEALIMSADHGPVDQKTATLRSSSASVSQSQRPGAYYSQALPGGPLPEETLKVLDGFESVDQRTQTPTTYSQKQRPGVYYQHVLPGGLLYQEALKFSDDPADQKAVTPTPPSASSPQKPSVYYQEALPGGPVSQETLKVSNDPVDQKTVTPTPAFYAPRQRSSVYYPQALSGGPLPEEALKISDDPADQKAVTPMSPSASSPQRQRRSVFYQQALPGGLPEGALKASDDSELVDQRSRTPTASSASSSQRPSIYYQPAFAGSQLLEESLKVPARPEQADQKMGVSATPSSPYPPGEEPAAFYRQALPSSHLPEESPEVSANQKTGTPTLPSYSYPFVKKPIAFYQNDFPISPLTTETLGVSALSRSAEQKTSPKSEPSYYSVGEKTIFFYEPALPDVQLTNEGLKGSVIPEPIAQKTGLPTVNSSYPDVEKSIVSYQQVSPDSHLTENAGKVSVVPGPTDQKTEISTVSTSSYSNKEKPSVSYQQEVSDLSEKALKVLSVLRPAEQKTGIPIVPSIPYSQEEKPITTYQQELPDLTAGVPRTNDQKAGIQILSPSSYPSFPQQKLSNIKEEALGTFVLPQPVVQKVGVPAEPLSYYSHREESAFSQQESLTSPLTEAALKVSAASVPVAQKTGTPTGPSGSFFPTEKLTELYPQTLPDNDLPEESLKPSTVPGLSDQNRRPVALPGSYSYGERLRISTVKLPEKQKTELPTTSHSSYSQREEPSIPTVSGPDDQKTPLPTVSHGSYPKRGKPGVFLQQQLPTRDQSEDILKISTVPEPTAGGTGIPVLLSGSYSNREKSDTFYPQELPDRGITEGVLKVTIIPEPDDKKTVLITALPRSFSHRENRGISYQDDLADRYPTEGAVKVSGGLGQTDQIAGLPTVSPGAYSHGEKNKLVSEYVQRLIEDLDSPNSCVSSNSMPLNSQVDNEDAVNKPESSVLGDAGSEEIRDMDHSSKTLKEIRTLLMEAENIALKRCNFPAPLVPFRDVNAVPCVPSKKVVCFKEPSATDVSHETHQREPIIEQSPLIECVQKDIGTQTNLKCQQGIENWKFFSSTTIRSPLPEEGGTSRMACDEPFRRYQAAKSVMRSEPEGCSATIGNKIIIPMMTIIKSDSGSDVSDCCCSWDSNLPETLESVSDVFLNFFPHTPLKTSIPDSREEEGFSESDDGHGSVDSLAAHVKYLLQCESSLNHARQILKNAEEEECRVRAQAWNLKFNLGRERGHSISELNEDDRRKVEEIKAKLFGHGRAAHVSESLQSPHGIGCTPEAVCSHIIIESHEKGCFRTLNAEQPPVDSRACVFKPAAPSEVIKGQQSPSSWRAGHSLSQSLDQNNHHFKVGNALPLQSHPPFQQLTPEDFKVSKDVGMPPFSANTGSWLSELADPTCVPPKEMDFPSTSQTPSPEPTKQFATSITFSSHRHSNCISDTSVFKVGVTEGSQCTGTSVGVFNSHVTEEHSSPRDLKQKSLSPSPLRRHSHVPGKEVAILAQGSRQSPKLPAGFEQSHQEEKLVERSNLKVSRSEPITGTNYSDFKAVQFSGNPVLISTGKPSSTLEVKEKNRTVTPDLPSCIFLEQRELFEQGQAPHTDHVRKHHSPSCLDIPSCIFLEQRQLFEQSKAPHVDHEMRESNSRISQCQDNVILDLPSPICLEEHRPPDVDDHMTPEHFPLPQGEDCVEKSQHTTKPHSCNVIKAEAEFSNVVSPQPPPDHCTLVTPECTLPSNRKALSCVRITLCPKNPSKLDSGILEEKFHSLDPASKTRINSEFHFDLQTISSRSLEPTSKLLTSKLIAQNPESLGSLGPKSPLDLQATQSPLPDSKTITQDLKTIPTPNSQIVTSKQTQVNMSDLEGYSKPEGTSVSADGSREQSKTPFSASLGKLSSDAITQITTESPEKTTFSSEIFINADDSRRELGDSSTQQTHKVPVKFASSSSVQQVTTSHSPDAQPVLLPYKPSGSTKMYYVPQLRAVPPFPDSKSDTTIESSHSGSNDAIAPDFPAQVLGTRDDDLPDTVNIKHKEGIYSKRPVTKAPSSARRTLLQKDGAGSTGVIIPEAPGPSTGGETLLDKKQTEPLSRRAVTKTAEPEVRGSLQKDAEGSSDTTAVQVQDRKTESLPGTTTMKQKEEIQNKKTIPKEVSPEEEGSLGIYASESEFENTTHSVFRSAKFYFHRPVHPPNDQDFCHESLGRSVFVRHSWKDFFHHYSDIHRENTCLSPPYPLVDKTMMDYTRIKSLSINVNLDNKMMHTANSQARDHPKSERQINESKRDMKVPSEGTTPHTVSLNELWNKYQERQKQKRAPDVRDGKELSLVERLDRLARLLQNPITHSLQASESMRDHSRGKWNVKGRSSCKQQKSKLQKRCKSLERGHSGDFRKGKVLSPHQPGRSNQIKIEQIKFDKYVLSKQPDLNSINTSSDSRPSEESEVLSDSPTNILSNTSSPVDSDVLTQTDREMALHERSSSISTIDTARLIQAFGHERLCLSPRRIKLYTSITNQQRRYLEKRCKHSKKACTSHPQMTCEHTRRRHIQVADSMISSDSVPSGSSVLSLNSTCIEQSVHMLNKGVQAGNVDIVTGARKHTWDVGVTFPTPSSSEARVEEDSEVTSWSEEVVEEKMLFTNYLGDKKLRKNKNSCEGASWFVPVENKKSGSKKENLPKIYGPGVSWFEPVTKTKPWREPLREQNCQGQRVDCQGTLGGPGGDDGREPVRPFVRATLQEALQLHRPDFISRSGERIKRLKLIVKERKLQNMFQSERDTLFNASRPLSRRVFLAAQKSKPIGRKEMLQRSKRIYEQLPEVQKKREEEKRKSEYKTYRLRAQLYKTKVTNQLLGRKIPWD